MRTSHSIAAALSTGLGLASAACSASSFLYVTTYPTGEGSVGKVTTLSLSESGLESVAASDDCGPYPSWLTQAGDILYCVDEAWPSPNGSLTSLQVGEDGLVSKLSSLPTFGGPVSTIIYGDGGRGLAVADYAGAGINTFNIADPAAIEPLQSELFPAPADNRSNPQEQARPHQAVLDPTGEFLVFPDLGADLLRVFKVDKETLQYTESTLLEFDRGTGPRHAAFFTGDSKTFLYVINELQNSVTGFAVTYNEDETLSFDQVYNATTHGGTDPVPEGTSAAEITVAPGSNFITLSSRFERNLEFTVANGTTVPSDPLITFSIDPETGALTHVQTAPAGGINPRHFSFNKDGTRVAVGLQSDGRVVILERDTETGEIGGAVAEVDIPGQPNFVLFKE
ncbi:hypothetical protein MMYC01_210551 [Madurella mycetomatis]|uniref:6-phosphogluconolactonase n=1 Tax=Madurella mycetomatis TaxID=100816 RepID=A0A175VRT9_9PEZI|nr:hypothetical protein MMYC01_210551 [Madurella mycetomatis]